MKNTNHAVLFSLGKELFGVSVENVLRVISVEKVFNIPKAPAFIAGAINLEGSVLPVVNLSRKIDLAETQLSDHSKIVVLDVAHDDEHVQVGVLIDDVLDVVIIEPSRMLPAPLENLGFDAQILSGMYKVDDDFYMILNVKAVFEKELAAVIQ